MESALKSKARDPVSEFCRWNDLLRKYAKEAGVPSAFDKPRKYKPKESEPLVYHLHGDVNTPQSMVLTERDYFDFVVNLNKDPEALMLPAIVRQALATSSLLFIGYTLEDISFRAIFQGVIGLQGTRFREISVSVQLPPPLTSEKVDKAQRYLDQYTRNMFEVRVFWGDVCQFVAELRQRWEGFKSGVVTS
jgi:hypothetical protein